MAVKKSELYSTLWESCNQLRGGMDASQYKDYVLALLFIKYVSDKYAMLPSGASMGDGYGPMIVAPRKLTRAEVSKARIAVPGTMTTPGQAAAVVTPLKRHR